ncbi:MAG: polysaccharide deacetylase family protein [Chitinivibrionales bacterium]|nr:polysaccharide deacetylase family protein [Chitinivibrionales bacterium]
MKTIIFYIIFLGVVFQTAYSYDNVPPSQKPPKNLASDNVPQFVVLGFDDQMTQEGMKAVVNAFNGRTNPGGKGQASTFDGTPARATFYTTSSNLGLSKELHKQAYSDGHEIGNHTDDHVTAFATDEGTWKTKMLKCNSDLSGAGISASSIVGFRTPFLQYTNATFKAIKSVGFVYDCSVEEGFQTDQTGGTFFWPYTLDSGSPGNKLFVEWEMAGYEVLTSYPGVWEMPCYVIVVPTDDECEKYGLQKGLRERIHKKIDYFDVVNGKITGLDYNLLYEAGLSGTEMGKVMCYSLDLHYNGNRSPFNFGAHSNYYGEADRISGLKYFLDYALQKPDVRVVPAIKVVDWMKNPIALDPGKTALRPDHSSRVLQKGSIKIASSYVVLQSVPAGDYSITLFSSNGREVFSIKLQQLTPGDCSFQLPQSIPSQMYIVRIAGAGSTLYQLLMKR